MSALPRPSELGSVALTTLKQELIPALPPELRYTAAMTVRALDYALGHSDDALGAGRSEAEALVASLASQMPPDILAQLDTYLSRERAKVASLTQKEPNS